MERKRRCKSLGNVSNTTVELSSTTPYVMEIKTPPISSSELKAFIDTLESADCEEESVDSCEFPSLRKIDAYLNEDISSGAMESSDSSRVKTETEDDEDETTDNTAVFYLSGHEWKFFSI